MPKKLMFLMFLTLCIALGGSLLTAEEDLSGEMCVPMGIIKLKPPESVEAKRSSVEFPHSDHFAHYDCKTCHHKWEGSSKIQNCTTSECHYKDTAKPEPGMKAVKGEAIKYYKKAFHAQCIGCHKDIIKKNKEAENSVIADLIKKPEIVVPGPTSCIKCHPK